MSAYEHQFAANVKARCKLCTGTDKASKLVFLYKLLNQNYSCSYRRQSIDVKFGIITCFWCSYADIQGFSSCKNAQWTYARMR